MGTILSIWLLVVGVYYLCTALFHLALKIPAIVIFVVCLPAMPFIVAYRNRQEHPLQARFICWGWAIVYALLILICYLDR